MAESSNVVHVPRYRTNNSRVQGFNYANTAWAVAVEVGVPFEEVLKPEFWAHVVQSKNMKIGDYLHVTPDDRSWWAWLIVRDCGNAWAKVGVIQKVDFEDMTLSADDDVTKGFSVLWQGPVNKYVVLREKDKAVISKGHKSKPEAQIAMIEHARSVAA
jgi:hypothetical protein